MKNVKAADVMRILRWVNCLDFDEFCAALELKLDNPTRQEYWTNKFIAIKGNLFEGIARELDDTNTEKLWAFALAKDADYASRNPKKSQ